MEMCISYFENNSHLTVLIFANACRCTKHAPLMHYEDQFFYCETCTYIDVFNW